MAILDLDMLNMGNRGRRAVRGLKTRMQVADREVVLGSVSDVMLKAVGKRGFSGIKSCNVGVPVASAISPSSSLRSTQQGQSTSHEQKQSQELSLTDLLRSSSTSNPNTSSTANSEAADEAITKMVAKVGRFWYTRCYESLVMGTDGRGESIFEDRALLEECEKWNSSFKLVVAYAQKPVQGRRRTNSV